jgi:hypothetical protein
MSEQGNDEVDQAPPAYGTPPAPQAPPAYGTPPAHGTPQAYGTPPSDATPLDQGTTPFSPVPTTAAYPGPALYQVQPPYPAQGYPGWEPSHAVLALVLGLIALFVFWPLAPFAWGIGRNEIRAVDAGRRDPANRGVAVAGMVLGIIGTALLVLGFVFVVIAVVTVASVARATVGG